MCIKNGADAVRETVNAFLTAKFAVNCTIPVVKARMLEVKIAQDSGSELYSDY